MVRTPYLPALSLEVIFVISPKPVVRGFFLYHLQMIIARSRLIFSQRAPEGESYWNYYKVLFFLSI